MAVLDPIRIVIENFDELNLNPEIDAPCFPGNPDSMDKFKINFDRIVYIERNDFREVIVYLNFNYSF